MFENLKNIKYLWVYITIGILVLITSGVLISKYNKYGNSQNINKIIYPTTPSSTTTISLTSPPPKDFIFKLIDTLYSNSQNMSNPNTPPSVNYTSEQFIKSTWNICKEYISQDIVSQITCDNANSLNVSRVILCILSKLTSKTLNIQKDDITLDDTISLKDNNEFFKIIGMLIFTHLLNVFSKYQCKITYNQNTNIYVFSTSSSDNSSHDILSWNQTSNMFALLDNTKKELNSIKDIVKITPSPTLQGVTTPPSSDKITPSWFRDIVLGINLDNMSLSDMGRYVFFGIIFLISGIPTRCEICPSI